jgi:glycosyltransferase involved in cell wall biosynthesis
MAHDHDLDVLMVPTPGSYTDEFVDGLEAHGASVRTSGGLFRVTAGIREGGVPDVLHLHFLDEFFLMDSRLLSVARAVAFLLELALARLLGVTVVWTVHNLHHHDNPHPRIEYAVRHLASYLCVAIVVHCDAAGDLVAEAYRLPAPVRSKIRTVPHGNYDERYPDEVTRDRARDRLGFDDDDRVLLFFGQVRRYKQVDELVRTFGRVDAADARLLVAGKPVDDDYVDDIAELAAGDDRVRTVFEFVPDEEVQVYMEAADVVVLPYRTILTSGTVLLAMTFANPVVAPRLGCVGELLDAEGGFPYDPDRRGALLDALEAATSASLCGLGEHNRSKVDHLDWSSIARWTLRVYTDPADPEPTLSGPPN